MLSFVSRRQPSPRQRAGVAKVKRHLLRSRHQEACRRYSSRKARSRLGPARVVRLFVWSRHTNDTVAVAPLDLCARELNAHGGISQRRAVVAEECARPRHARALLQEAQPRDALAGHVQEGVACACRTHGLFVLHMYAGTCARACLCLLLLRPLACDCTPLYRHATVA